MAKSSDSIYWQIAQRNLGVYSREEQQKLREGKVAIVGVGCDGGMDAYILARMGIGKLGLIDFDRNELSNLNRQPMATFSTIGQPKVLAAAQIIKDLNPTTEVVPIDQKLTEENAEDLIKGFDVVLQGMDSIVGRIIAHRAALKRLIPSVAMTGQPPFRSIVSTLMPNGPNYEELFGIEFVRNKLFRDHPEMAEQIENLKMERAEHASRQHASAGWLERYKVGQEGWGITPERAYITSIFQCHEAIALLVGRTPKAIAPKAYVSDLNGLSEFGKDDSLVAIMNPPNGKNWDYRAF
jgi:molybdopterin/thiamine biosynthesis adenylyltransferase